MHRVQNAASALLQAIATEIKSATTSMTSVPKPLKFLRQHYAGLKATLEGMPTGNPNRAAMADVLSVLAMNSGAEGARESLTFRLAGSNESVGAWGHEYIRWERSARCLAQLCHTAVCCILKVHLMTVCLMPCS